MDVHTTDEAPEPELANFNSLQIKASSEETMFFSGKPSEVLTKVELDLACFAEKLVNLNILVMHVAMRESDFEAFVSENDHELGDNALKALEFDFLSGVLDSEVREVDSFMSTVQSEIDNVREFMCSYEEFGDSLKGIEDKIRDCEESLKQSEEQVTEIKAQSAKFQRILSSGSGEEKEEGGEGAGFEENGDILNLNQKVKLQTAEQQRHFLTMLEKSLAREMELEKKVNELKQLEKALKSKLQSSQKEASFAEEENLSVWQKLFEAEYSSEVFKVISQETLSRLQLLQCSLNDSIQREEKMRSELEDLRESISKAETMETNAESAEIECKLLRETNTKLNEELAVLLAKNDEYERQLKEYEIRLQHALAFSEATEEKQSLLYDSINDMDNIIEDLKSRVSRAEIRAEGVEENCIKLSETNSELNEEMNILRKRLEYLEGSLRKSEESKMETAKDIGIRTKVITNLVMQLAFERERLQKQICSLKKENKLMSQQTAKDMKMQEYDTAARAEDSKEGSDVSTATFEMEKTENNKFGDDGVTKLESVRNVDARQINYVYVVMAALAFAFSALAGFLVNQAQN